MCKVYKVQLDRLGKANKVQKRSQLWIGFQFRSRDKDAAAAITDPLCGDLGQPRKPESVPVSHAFRHEMLT